MRKLQQLHRFPCSIISHKAGLHSTQRLSCCFLRVYLLYLLVVDDDDFHKRQQLFNLGQQRAIATALNTLVFRTHCPEATQSDAQSPARQHLETRACPDPAVHSNPAKRTVPACCRTDCLAGYLHGLQDVFAWHCLRSTPVWIFSEVLGTEGRQESSSVLFDATRHPRLQAACRPR